MPSTENVFLSPAPRCFSVDGIRHHPCGQQKAAESQHKAVGQPRQRSGRAAHSRYASALAALSVFMAALLLPLCFTGGVMTTPAIQQNTFSVDGIRHHPCGQQKAAESQHKAVGQPRQRSFMAALLLPLCFTGGVMTTPAIQQSLGGSPAALSWHPPSPLRPAKSCRKSA
jgi:hypothetical protein